MDVARLDVELRVGLGVDAVSRPLAEIIDRRVTLMPLRAVPFGLTLINPPVDGLVHRGLRPGGANCRGRDGCVEPRQFGGYGCSGRHCLPHGGRGGGPPWVPGLRPRSTPPAG
jgi:hypothetical protein